MPIDRLVLIVVCVLVAAALTVWVATFLAAVIQVPAVSVAALPLLLVLYIGWRVLQERLSNKEDDHYDRIEK